MITLRRADNDISEDDDDSYKPGPYWSLMLEISEGPLKEISNSTLVEQVRKRFFKFFRALQKGVGLDGCHFRLLENSVIEIGKAVSNNLMFNRFK